MVHDLGLEAVVFFLGHGRGFNGDEGLLRVIGVGEAGGFDIVVGLARGSGLDSVFVVMFFFHHNASHGYDSIQMGRRRLGRLQRAIGSAHSARFIVAAERSCRKVERCKRQR